MKYRIFVTKLLILSAIAAFKNERLIHVDFTWSFTQSNPYIVK